MAYLRSAKPADAACVFCVAAASADDREHLVLHRNATCYLICNRYPYNNGHLMVVPYRHVGDLTDLTEEELHNLIQVARYGVILLRKAFQPHAFNLGMNLGVAAGAGITDHVHMHIVPRWNGDTNYMSVVARTRVISELLTTTYDQLATAAAEEPFPGEKPVADSHHPRG